jgi:tRNA1(Val) A37 N6-methylase TrmN6
VAKAVYDYFKPKDVLDMSAGYGGRLMGFLASNCNGHYTGIDPSIKSCHGNREIALTFGLQDRVKIICDAFEDNWEKLEGLPKVDLAFTSTPYFAKEIYEKQNEKQSRERYPDYKDWLRGFLKPMMKKTRAALELKGIMALNIADIKIKNKTYPLQKDTVRIAEHVGFTLVEELKMAFFGFGRGLEKQKTEPIFIFEKS